MRRWRAADALRLAAEHRMTTIAGVPTQLALDAPRARLRRLRPRQRALPRRRRRTDHARPRRRGARPVPGRARRRATRAPRPASGSAPRSTTPRRTPSSASAARTPSSSSAVLDDDDRPVPPGEVGQVCLRSPAVMSGYWRDPDATRAAFTADGFVRTGDLGWVDDRGRLRLVGRSKEMYVRGGYNVYPVEVEAVLSTHPAVAGGGDRARRRPGHGRDRRCRRRPARRRRATVARATARVRHAAPRAVQAPRGAPRRRSLPLTAMEKVDRRRAARGCDRFWAADTVTRPSGF